MPGKINKILAFFCLLLLIASFYALKTYKGLADYWNIYHLIQSESQKVILEPVSIYKKQKLLSFMLKLDRDLDFFYRPDIKKKLSGQVFLYEFTRGRILSFDDGLILREDMQRLVTGVQLGKEVFPSRSEAVFPGTMDLITFLNPGDELRILYDGYQNSGPLLWTTKTRGSFTVFVVFPLDKISEDQLKTLIHSWLDIHYPWFNPDINRIAKALFPLLGLAIIIFIPLQWLFLNQIKPYLHFRLHSKPILIATISFFLALVLTGLLLFLNHLLFQFQVLKAEESRVENLIEQSASQLIIDLEPLHLALTEAVKANQGQYKNIKIGYFIFDIGGEVITNTGQIQEILFTKLSSNIVTAITSMDDHLLNTMNARLQSRLHESLIFLRIEKTANVALGMDRQITSANRNRLIAADWGSQKVYFWFGKIADASGEGFFGAFVSREQVYTHLLQNQDAFRNKFLVQAFNKTIIGTKTMPPSVTKRAGSMPELLYTAPLDYEKMNLLNQKHLKMQIQYGIRILILGMTLSILYAIRTTRLLYHVKSVSFSVLNQKPALKKIPKIQDEFFTLLDTIYSCESELEHKKNLTPFVAQQLIRLLTQKDGTLGHNLHGIATIVFSDIRSFTTISEKESAENIVSMLNEYFDLWQTSVDHFGGITERFIGDAIVIIFPSALDKNHAQIAVECSIKLLNMLKDLNLKRVEEGKFAIQNGIGISSGLIRTRVIGNSTKRHLVSTGTAVELAETLEALTKTHNTRILCDQATRELTEHCFSWVTRDSEAKIYALDQEIPSGKQNSLMCDT